MVRVEASSDRSLIGETESGTSVVAPRSSVGSKLGMLMVRARERAVSNLRSLRAELRKVPV